MTKNTVKTYKLMAWENVGGVLLKAEKNFFSDKIQNKSDFILNSGNSYVTLQPELCPAVW